LKRSIGEGSYGKVFLGVNETTGAQEAVKVIPKRLVKDLAHVRDVWRETTLLERLRHPGIVLLHEVHHLSRHVCLRMELVGRFNIFQVQRASRGGRFGLTTVWNVGLQVAAALAHCHENGIAHRDIKHENVVLCDTAEPPEFWRVKLIDFGHAVDVAKAAAERICGTMPFAAPEVLRAHHPSVLWDCEGDPDPRSADVWAHSVMLVEMAYKVGEFNRALGWPMDVEPGESRGAELAAFFHGGIRRLSEALSKIPPPEDDVDPLDQDFLAVLTGALRVEPGRRWSMSKVHDKMTACLEAVGQGASPDRFSTC